MILHHKARRKNTGEEICGFLTKMWGDYYITKEEDENTGYPVDEASIQPCFEELPNGSQFVSLLQGTDEKEHSFPIVGLQFCAGQ